MISKKKFIILVIVAAVGLGAAFAMGLFTAEDARFFGRRVYYEGRGTVKEAVDTVTNVGATGSGDPAKASACRDNIRRIELAKRAAANKAFITVGEVPESDVVAALGGSMPRCPDGGRYRLNTLESMVTCSIGAGVVSDPNDDHVVNNF